MLVNAVKSSDDLIMRSLLFNVSQAPSACVYVRLKIAAFFAHQFVVSEKPVGQRLVSEATQRFIV